MPIYGYNCKACDYVFDVLQKISDPKLTDCPECGEAALRKQLSAPKFRLKGKGWYETDFKTGDQRNLAGDAEKTSTDKKKDSDTVSKKPEATTTSTDSKAKTA